jgi:hypothetical protein
LRTLRNEFAMTREAGKVMSLGDACERGQAFRAHRTRAAHVNVEARIRCGRLDIEWFSSRSQRFGNRPGGPECAAKPWRQDGARINGDYVVSTWRRKSDLQNVMGSASRM